MLSHTQVSNGSLVLGNVTELDEGNYTCQAVNNGGTAEAHIRIEVLQGFATGQGTWGGLHFPFQRAAGIRGMNMCSVFE